MSKLEQNFAEIYIPIKKFLRPGQCLAIPDLLPHELLRGQATGLYQWSSGLRSMAYPEWLTAISFNSHTLQIPGSLIVRECFDDLPRCPFGGRMLGAIEMNDTTASM